MLSEDWWAPQVSVCIFCEFPSYQTNTQSEWRKFVRTKMYILMNPLPTHPRQDIIYFFFFTNVVFLESCNVELLRTQDHRRLIFVKILPQSKFHFITEMGEVAQTKVFCHCRPAWKCVLGSAVQMYCIIILATKLDTEKCNKSKIS